MSFGEILKSERKKYKGLTQQKLAEKSGISRTYLSDVENDRYNPSVDFIKKVSNGLSFYGGLSEEEATKKHNFLMQKAGYGFRSLKDLTDDELMEQMAQVYKGFEKDRVAFSEKMNNIDFSKWGFSQRTLLEQTLIFAQTYSNIADGDYLIMIGVMIGQLNKMYDAYIDEEKSYNEKIEDIKFYAEDKEFIEEIYNIFGDVSNDLIDKLNGNQDVTW